MEITAKYIKIVVFRKGTARTHFSCKFGNDDIQMVSSIPYLGILFSSNGLFTQAQCKLADQANKSLFLLYKRLNKFRYLKPSVSLDLFYKCISSILNYSANV